MGALIEINTDGFAKLAETICNATGLAAYGRKKMANADSYAAIKQAETETQVELLKLKRQDDIADYVLQRESRKLKNVQSVLEKSASHFKESEQVSDKPVNIDWTNRFINIVENISDDSLQEMWARILSGEVKRPKSFSLRTLDLLQNITKDEAQLFVKAAGYYLANNYLYTDSNVLSLHEILLLGEIGFINSEELIKNWEVQPHNKLEVLIDKQTMLVLHNDTDKIIRCQLSIRKLSKAGAEILPLIEKSNRENFCDIIAAFVKSKGISQVYRHTVVEYGDIIRYSKIGTEIP